MKNPFSYNYKNSNTEFFFWFGIWDKFTFFRISACRFYCFYDLVILNITLFKYYNYETYKKNIIKLKIEKGIK